MNQLFRTVEFITTKCCNIVAQGCDKNDYYYMVIPK